MKITILLIILSIASLLFSVPKSSDTTTQEKQDTLFADSIFTNYQPLYMQNRFTDNLWINQPLKEYNRYQNILFSVVFSYFTFNRTDSDGGPYIMATIPTAAVFGGAIGLSKAGYHQFFSSNTVPKFRKPILFIENGVLLNDEPGYTTKIAYKRNFSCFDEIGVTFGCEQYNYSNLFNLHAEITDYKLNIDHFYLFYSLGLGYSDSHYKTEDSDSYEKNLDFSANLQAGIKLNLFDFTYFKVGFNYHYSPILDKIADESSEHDDSIKSNFVFIIGTELF